MRDIHHPPDARDTSPRFRHQLSYTQSSSSQHLQHLHHPRRKHRRNTHLPPHTQRQLNHRPNRQHQYREIRHQINRRAHKSDDLRIETSPVLSRDPDPAVWRTRRYDGDGDCAVGEGVESDEGGEGEVEGAGAVGAEEADELEENGELGGEGEGLVEDADYVC